MKQRVALYARVSTARQETEQTIEAQIEALQTYVQEQALALEERHIYLDDGYSGARLDRPGLDALRDAAAEGQFDLMLVCHPDRLARDYVWQEVIRAELDRYGCQLHFLQCPLSSRPEDKLLLQVQGMFAEYERAQITERMRRGKLRKAHMGQLRPWSTPPYGYRYVQDDQFSYAIIEETEAEIIRQMFHWLVEERLSARQITKRLNELQIPPQRSARWHPSSVYGMLTNETYAGTAYVHRRQSAEPRKPRDPAAYRKVKKSSYVMRPREEWIPIPVPAIIDPETYQRAVEQLQTNRLDAPRNTKYQYLLRRLVKCGQCGRAMSAVMQQGKYAYYYCAKGHSLLDVGRKERCSSRRVRADRLDKAVWARTVELLQTPELIVQQFHLQREGLAAQGSLGQQIERLEHLTRMQQRQIDRLVEAYQIEVINLAELARRRQQLEQKIRVFENQIQDLRQQQERRLREGLVIQEIERFCEVTRVGLKSAAFEERRRIVELIVEQVVVVGTEVTIHHIVIFPPAVVNLRPDRKRRGGGPI
jgi:site-specific DNA recombinase